MTDATYNGQGLRTSATFTTTSATTKQSITEHYLYSQTSSVPDLIMDSNYAYLYLNSIAPYEQINLTTGEITYLIGDANGSIRGVMNQNGSLKASVSYGAYGNPTTKGGLSAYTPFGFAGSYMDPTGLYYMINRYYHPSTGQFISVDPLVAQTRQPYAYTGGDPVNGVDPMGLADCGWNPICYVGSGIDKANNAVNSAASAATNYLNNRANVFFCGTLGGQYSVFSTPLGCGPEQSMPSPVYPFGSSPASASFTVTCSFSIGGVTSGPYDWGNLETLLDHFGRHGPDFGSQTPEEYAQQASSFLEQMVRNGEIKIDPEDGAIRVYDPETNTFAAYNPNGTSRTIFKPDEGQSYWDTQPGDEPWFGGE